MNTKFLLFGITLATLVLTASISAAQPDTTPLLRYQFATTQTNVFRVQVETTSEFGTETLSGNLFLTTALAGSNAFRIACRGTLNPKRDPRSPMMFTPGQPPRWLIPISFGENSEVLIDERGRILRSMADAPLAIPLGSFFQSVVEQYSPEPTRSWTATDVSGVLDDPAALGPALSLTGPQPYANPFHMGGRSVPGILPAKREITFEVKDVAEQTVTIAKKVQLQTFLQSAGQPRFSADGQGQSVIDRQTGLIRESELKCSTLLTTENASRRTTVVWNCKQLLGDELKQALNPPPPEPAPAPAKLTEKEIDEILASLRSPDMSRRHSALNRLRNAEPVRVTPEFRAAMAELAADSDTFVQQAAAGMLAKVAGKEEIPVLLKLLNSPDYTVRQSAINGLSRFKDKRAIDGLVEFIASAESDASTAVTAVTRIGPEAEDAVLRLLKEKNIGTRRQACTILKLIGTRKSLEPLKDLAVHPDRQLSDAAADAVRTISMRL